MSQTFLTAAPFFAAIAYAYAAATCSTNFQYKTSDLAKSLLQCSGLFSSNSKNQNADIGLTTPQVIKKYGYPVETHTATTADGYILTVFRIPYSPKSPLKGKAKKTPVFIQHGLLGNSQNFLYQYGPRNLAFLLADNGYDVFLGNNRGSKYSLKHTTLKSSQPAYWDFSWYEMGMNDVPANMNLVTSVNGNKKMYYIGHSQGTTQYFVAMSQIPKLNRRILTGFMMAPIAYMFYSPSVFRAAAPLGYNGQYLTSPLLGGELPASQQYTYTNSTGSPLAFTMLCDPTAVACSACSNLLFALFGFDAYQTNYTNLPLVLSTFPDSSSTKSVVHYAQSMTKGNFCQFDYLDAKKNAARYKGRKTPPCLDLSKITAPTTFQYGPNDNLGDPTDVKITASKFKTSTLKANVAVKFKYFTHMDFITAKDADKLVYCFIVNAMNNKTYLNK